MGIIPPPTPEELEEDLKELFEERAAIMEFEGGLPRKEAERQARLIVYGEILG